MRRNKTFEKFHLTGIFDLKFIIFFFYTIVIFVLFLFGKQPRTLIMSGDFNISKETFYPYPCTLLIYFITYITVIMSWT